MHLNVIARGDGAETIVFLHGLFGQARNLGYFQREAAKRYRTFALDLRNHGESPHGPVSYAEMARDVMETLDSLGVGTFSVVGHSMGGKVSMMLALAAADRVSRLMVGDMAPTRTNQGQGDLISRLKSLKFPDTLTRNGAIDLLDPYTGNRGVSELLAQNIRVEGTPGWSIGFDEIAYGIGMIENWPIRQARPYEGPTLFLRGGESTYVMPKHHADIYRLFPKAQIRTLEGAGHWLHAEQPKAFAAEMMAFLQGAEQMAA